MQETRAKIFEKLKEILLFADPDSKDIVETCSEASSLADDFGFTSVGILCVVISIEETFGIQFEDTGVADFPTLGDVIDYIEKKLAC